ncbi:MAG: isocitrate lyase/PEP mutase family protein [Pelagibacteraceae bacterium]|nr:isocitrate lyase/PEP mutase family protein [Pelagibacteraceae bacterium]
MNKKTSLLKKYLKDGKCYSLPTCHDPISAKLIEKKGFKISFIGGFALSSASLGYPDASLITQKELVDATKIICNHTNLPIIVDADTGFGGLANVYRTVKELEIAGASGLVLEDQVFPKRCALTDKVKLLNLKDAKERLSTAIKAAKENKNIFIIARTDALTSGSITEALKRSLEYKKLGADAIFITGINSLKEIKYIKSQLRNIPLMLNITQNVKFSIKDVSKNKFKFALFSQQILNGYIDSTKKTLELIKKNKIPKSINKASDTLSLLEFEKYLKIEETKK